MYSCTLKKLQSFALLFVLLFSFNSFADPCTELVKSLIAKKGLPGLEKTGILAQRLKAFADVNHLPIQILEVGPAQRRVQKIFVAIDMNDEAMVAKYLAEFNLDDKDHPTLALEFGFEVVNQYVTGVLRTSSDPKAPVYRWGRKDLARNEWAPEWMIEGGFNRYPARKQNPIWGYSHLIQLNEKEVKNVKHFLDNPLERGPCKSDNCVAWTASIELGVTKKDATDEERNYLFSELGVSRSSAHFEIGRRLMHAANERHTGVVVFVNGEKGLDAFKTNLRNFLPPEPQIPYTNIIKGLGHDPAGDLMQAVAKIPDGAKIFFPIAAGASPEAMSALIQAAPHLKKGFEISLLVNGINESTLRKGAELLDGKIKFKSFFVGSNMRKLHGEGLVKYIPGYLSDFPRFVRDPEMKDFKYEAIIVRVSPADENGNHSFGPNYDMINAILEGNPNIKIIAEVNPNVPFTTGENFIHQSKLTAMFKSKAELAGPPVVPFTNVEKHIGDELGKLVIDGATLQIGIGNIFGGLTQGLVANGRKNLAISTEMFGDSLKEIMEKGIATKAETGFAYGSNDLYKWLHKNPKVKFVSTEEVNSPANIQNTEKFHAINTALQVRLTGDVNAEFGPEGRLSSPGGQVEFMSGAARSKGGKSIIAIRSTAKNGSASSITIDLYNGHVTTPSESVHYVVTEYGTAVLKGKSTSEKAVALINVAHPKFRAQLRDEAIEKHLISPSDANNIVLDQPIVGEALPALPVRKIASAKEGFFSQFWNMIRLNLVHIFSME
jgi:acyl-CoA hydrolase